MRRLIRGEMWILPLVAVFILGGPTACQKSGDAGAAAINWAKLIKVKKNPVRISPLVREMKGSESFFRAEITNVSKVPIEIIDGTIVLLSDKGFVVEARPYSEHSVIPPGGKAR